MNTRRLVVEEGGFVYDADSYSDDLPYYEQVAGKRHLVVPYTFDVNDQKFVAPVRTNAFTDRHAPTAFIRHLIATPGVCYAVYRLFLSGWSCRPAELVRQRRRVRDLHARNL